MTYTVKEIFYTLQGEGAHTGRAAVFCRFSGCNLWTGRQDDRTSAICTFCDTDFVGVSPDGGKFSTADALAEAINETWIKHQNDINGTFSENRKFVVCTGGEPLLQLDAEAVEALHRLGFTVAVETNGTQAAVPGLDWICVSPKSTAPLALTQGDELKLVYPQLDAPPERFASLPFKHFFLQPMDGPDLEENTRRTLEYCLAHPQWRMSVQVHKVVGIR